MNGLTLPVALQDEQAVLGMMLRQPQSRIAADIGGMLMPEHFADPIHARIYDVVRCHVADGTGPHDLDRIGDDLRADLPEVGGVAYLQQLVVAAPTADAAAIAAASVREAWARRQFIDFGEELTRLGAEAVAGGFEAAGISAADQAGYFAARLRPLVDRLAAVGRNAR